MSNRNKWAFAYTADRLLTAAQAKKSYSEARVKWWADKREEVLNKIRAEGLEVDESLNVDPKFSSNYARQPTVQIRNDLLRDLQECNEKRREHTEKVSDYSAWIQVLESQGQSTLQLDQDDWLFFFGK